MLVTFGEQLGQAHIYSDIHCESKKQDTKLLPITLPNIGRFTKFFHC